ncbi:hypothetical protein G5714_006977 [Onychostoma macrolepis]|uniref:Uncharacterized protein n=1 Tax=Onychostoma macrolepis TaxID=369639 RepID=A0A7J6CZ13_9TELE|nr:hypothetical protein G5714_006977 [Onychostoma macrolepis]
MSIKTCGVCEGPIELPDGHDLCVFCLGRIHAEAAVIESNCPHCGEMCVKAIRMRIAILLNEQPSLSLQQSPSASYAEPWKTKSRRPEVEAGRPAGEHMSALYRRGVMMGQVSRRKTVMMRSPLRWQPSLQCLDGHGEDLIGLESKVLNWGWYRMPMCAYRRRVTSSAPLMLSNPSR